MSKKQREIHEKHRSALEETLNETIVDTIKQSALPNSLAWLGVVAAAFVINLLILVAVTGG